MVALEDYTDVVNTLTSLDFAFIPVENVTEFYTLNEKMV